MTPEEVRTDSAALDSLDGLVVRPRWREPKVRRALIGLVFVIGVFVIAPVVAMLVVAN
ncbi:MAG: hypothetical protein ACRDV3_01940 [Acidothermaceae bacterium]